MQKYAFSNLDKFETSSLVTRMTTDVTVLQNTVNGGYRPLVRSPVMLVMGVGLSFWMNPRLALVFLVCAPVLGGVLFVIVRRVAPCTAGSRSGGPAEQRGAGGPHRHPGGQGVCPRGVRGGEVSGGQL